MVIEHFRPGCIEKIYRRFKRNGRMLPDGLNYCDSWLSKSNDRCFQLMETVDVALFEVWFDQWSDLIEFELVPIQSTDMYMQSLNEG